MSEATSGTVFQADAVFPDIAALIRATRLSVLILRSLRSRRLEGWPQRGFMVRDARRRAPHHEVGRNGPRLSQSSGTVVPPSPSARCIITVSSQRPNLRPTLQCVPTIWKPHLV